MSPKYCSFSHISVGFEDKFCHSCRRDIIKEKSYYSIWDGKLKEIAQNVVKILAQKTPEGIDGYRCVDYKCARVPAK